MALTNPFSGRRNDVGIAKEGTRGTTAASADFWLPHAAFSFMEKVTKVRDESAFGNIAQPRGADIVKRYSEGEIEFNIRDQSIGLIMLALLGTETFATNTPQSGVGQHTFTVNNNNQHQSLSVFQKNDVETLAAGNCMVTSFALNAVLDQYVRVTLGLMGLQFGNDSESVTYLDENRFRPQDVAIKLADTSSALSGASAIGTVRSLNLNVNKNVEDYQGLGSIDPNDFVNRDFVVSGSFEIAFQNDTYKDYTLLNQKKAMSIKLTNAQAVVGTSTNPSLEIIMDELDFDNFDIDYSNENIVILTANFVAHYNYANSRMIRAILINGKNSAY